MYKYIEARILRNRRLFSTEDDFIVFFRTLIQANRDNEVSLLAFCVLNESYHLVVKGNEKILAEYESYISESCKDHYARTRGRGHAFNELRTYTRKITDYLHLIDAIKYIWRLPVDRDRCPRIEDYTWSSYRLLKKNDRVISHSELESLMPECNWQLFARTPCRYWADREPRKQLSEESARSRIETIATVNSIREIARFDIKRQGLIYEQALKEGVSKRQICRLMDISFYALSKALDSANSSVPNTA